MKEISSMELSRTLLDVRRTGLSALRLFPSLVAINLKLDTTSSATVDSFLFLFKSSPVLSSTSSTNRGLYTTRVIGSSTRCNICNGANQFQFRCVIEGRQKQKRRRKTDFAWWALASQAVKEKVRLAHSWNILFIRSSIAAS